MRARWDEVIDPFGQWDLHDDYVPEVIHHEGEILGTVSKLLSTYFVIAMDDGKVREVLASRVTVKVER